MRYEVVFAPEADDQLEEIFSYIADRGTVLIAERYTRRSLPPARISRISRTAAHSGLRDAGTLRDDRRRLADSRLTVY